jgi:ElaB/YqjD/DUF883 family membrane-anchored ribosome-binding protein
MLPERSKALSAIWPVIGIPRQKGAPGRRQGTAQKLYGQAKDAAREVSDSAAGFAKQAYENGGETCRDSSEALAKKIQQNPLSSILIAGAVGFALALFLARSPRRPPPRWRYYG